MKNFVLSQKKLRLLFLSGGIAFVFIMFGIAWKRSADRVPIVAEVKEDTVELSKTEKENPKEESQFHLQDFHRVEVKDGQPIWEVKAKEAKYYADKGVTNLDQALLIVYQKDSQPIEVSATEAKLFLEKGILTKAELEGVVTLELKGSLDLETSRAVYNMLSRTISAPKEVKISGPGYKVFGESLSMHIDDRVVDLSGGVMSKFEPGAKIPQGVQ
jgi:LPS export ABC transporter protein LptC